MEEYCNEKALRSSLQQSRCSWRTRNQYLSLLLDTFPPHLPLVWSPVLPDGLQPLRPEVSPRLRLWWGRRGLVYSAEYISGCEDVMTGCDDCGGAGPPTPSLEAGESCVTSKHYCGPAVTIPSPGYLSEAQGNPEALFRLPNRSWPWLQSYRPQARGVHWEK